MDVIEWSRYSFYTPEELEARGRSAEVERVEAQALKPSAESLTEKIAGLEVTCTVHHAHAADVLKTVAEGEQASHPDFYRATRELVSRLKRSLRVGGCR